MRATSGHGTGSDAHEFVYHPLPLACGRCADAGLRLRDGDTGTTIRTYGNVSGVGTACERARGAGTVASVMYMFFYKQCRVADDSEKRYVL